MDSSVEEDDLANVTAVDSGVSTEELVARARRAGNINNKDKNTPPPTKRSTVAPGDRGTKRKEPPIDLTKEAGAAMGKIPKKLNSQMFPKDIRPDWLQDDDTIDELTRAEALQTISQWNMTKAMMKQNDLTEEKNRKSKGSLKKDQEVKKSQSRRR